MVFFFSSRRRHTRSLCDWSSDVCSSDLDLFGLMRAQVVGDDVDFFFFRLAGNDLIKEFDELDASVPGAGFAEHFPGAGVKRRVQRKGAMAIVLKAMTLGSPWGKREHRIQSIKCLDSALFIHTEDRGMHRCLEIQSDNVGCFLFKLRIIAYHITPQPMRLNAKLEPDPINGRMTNAQMFAQSIATPVGGSVTWPCARSFQDFAFHLRRAHPTLTASVARIQTAQPPLLKTSLPDTDIAISAVQAPTNFRKTISFGH